MRSNFEFSLQTPTFWALIRYISERRGYSKNDGILSFTFNEIADTLNRDGVISTDEDIEKARQYFIFRSETLNLHFKSMLMDAAKAEDEFFKLKPLHYENQYLCKLPLNKQKGEMRQIAFFTAIINILAERTLRESNFEEYSVQNLPFEDDPRQLVYILDDDRRFIGSSSRRFDGAFPSIINPIAIWEIKEYYYATTFGSRIADGVFETQLDGYEFKQIEDMHGYHVDHIFFFDAYHTWWDQGKSYLCRIFDALHMGLVDEVIVGKEVLTRWPELLLSYVETKMNQTEE
ncbi:MAG: hypothetical protein LBO70_02595 [Clostridiales Family XIII bacterium]|jgi:hypothetical protein|nr:hypothetical protein [Clostridiales Family XIII bacterium]